MSHHTPINRIPYSQIHNQLKIEHGCHISCRTILEKFRLSARGKIIHKKKYADIIYARTSYDNYFLIANECRYIYVD